jgi:hypothetical protein
MFMEVFPLAQMVRNQVQIPLARWINRALGLRA